MVIFLAALLITLNGTRLGTFAYWTPNNINNLKIYSNIVSNYWNQMKVLCMTSRELLHQFKGILTLIYLHRWTKDNSKWGIKTLGQFNSSLSCSFLNSFKLQNPYRQLTIPKHGKSWTICFIYHLPLGSDDHMNPVAHKAHLKSASTILRSRPTDTHLTEYTICGFHEMRTYWTDSGSRILEGSLSQMLKCNCLNKYSVQSKIYTAVLYSIWIITLEKIMHEWSFSTLFWSSFWNSNS